MLFPEIPPYPAYLHKDNFLQKRLDNDLDLSYYSQLGNIKFAPNMGIISQLSNASPRRRHTR